MVFKNGGHLSRAESWTYRGTVIEVVNKFTYVGAVFTPKLSFDCMASEQAIKGKRPLNSILSSLYKYGQLSSSTFFKIFDVKISPIMLYGSELWGFCERHAIENVLLFVCNNFLCTNIKSCNAAVLWDCGRFPILPNFISCVRQLLQNNGFNFIWINQDVVNEKLFLHQFTERLKDTHLQRWFSNLEMSPKLILYKNIKCNYERETY
ncbi:hypothetical protein MAR_027855, partial [Mya arenaria]